MQPGALTHTDSMPVRLHHIVVDAHDLPGLARFWTQALGWKVLSEREREIVIGTDENAPVGMCFMPVTDPKTVKNRVHLDLTSSAQDRDQEIERLVALGARRVDIGQTGTESWTVLADPEGNEFCVIRPKETLIRLGSAPAGADRPVCGMRPVLGSLWSGSASAARRTVIEVLYLQGCPHVMAPLFRVRPVAGPGAVRGPTGRTVRRGRAWAAAAWLGRVRRRSRLSRRARRTRPRRAGRH
jgi:predicted enzyme related to lactoylglutathione lyase